jgi:uncharacterized protein YjcR
MATISKNKIENSNFQNLELHSQQIQMFADKRDRRIMFKQPTKS